MNQSLNISLGIAITFIAIACGSGGGSQETSQLNAIRAQGDAQLLQSSTGTAIANNRNSDTNNEQETPEVFLAKTETFDQVIEEVHLLMSYDGAADTFLGTIENTSSATISIVEVEVELSGNIELPSSSSTNLLAGEVRNISISAGGQSFTGWLAELETEAEDDAEDDANEANDTDAD